MQYHKSILFLLNKNKQNLCLTSFQHLAKNSIESSRKMTEWTQHPIIAYRYSILLHNFRTNNYNYISLFLYSIYRSTDRMLMVFRASCNNIRWTTRSIRWQRQYHQPNLYDTIWTRATWLHILVSWPQGKRSIFFNIIFTIYGWVILLRLSFILILSFIYLVYRIFNTINTANVKLLA